MKTSVNENEGNNSKKWLIIGIAFLVVIAAVSWFLSRDRGGMQEGTVIITAGDVTLGSFTIADLEKMPSMEKRIVVTPNCNGACGNDDDTPIEYLYTGVTLLEVLNTIDPAITQEYTKVITRGIDYYSQVMEMTEIEEADEVYVVYRDFGKPLKTIRDKEGSLHLIVCSDGSGQRFTKYLVQLELQ